MSRTLRVGIVGYGTAGQAAALLLSRDGHHVEVYERAPVLGPVGAGFLLQPTGLQVLWSMGLLNAALAHGARVDRLYGETATGRPVMDMRYRELDARLCGLGLQRGALFGLLDTAWDESRRVHCGIAIARVDAEAGTLHDADGHVHGPFDLVLVADGAHSSLRTQVDRPRLDAAYPWGAQWCLVPAGDWPWLRELRQRYVAARRMVGMLPVGTRPGDDVPRISFFWSVPAQALDGVDGVDPDTWRADVDAVWPHAAQLLHGTCVRTGLARARYRDSVAGGWHRGRAVLVGDAAHAMSPQLGQGVNMALMDADALARALRTHADVDDALAAYQRERRAHVAVYHLWSRWLTPVFQSDRDGVAWMRDRAMHPLSRIPGGRGQMLRVLTGTRHGWLGTLKLEPAFLARMADASL